MYIRCWGAQSWVRTSHFENAIEKVLMPNKAYIKECHLTGWVLLIFICKYLNIDIDCSYPSVANNIPIVFDLINNLHDMLLGSTKMTGRVWSLFTMIHRLCICSTLVFLFKSKKPLLQKNERKVKKARASFPPHFSVQENAKKKGQYQQTGATPPWASLVPMHQGNQKNYHWLTNARHGLVPNFADILRSAPR